MLGPCGLSACSELDMPCNEERLPPCGLVVGMATERIIYREEKDKNK